MLLAVLASFSAGVVGSVFTAGAVDAWYLTLKRPFFTPPSWLFGLVWTALYLLMGVSLYRIWIKVKNPIQNTAIKIFAVHLIVNALWSIVFFGFQDPGLALLVIVVLLALIVYLVKAFYQVDKKAGILLLPYLSWVSFAAILNFAFWRLN